MTRGLSTLQNCRDRATALSLPDHHAEIVGRKETRPAYVSKKSGAASGY